MDHLIQIPQVDRAWEPIPEPWVTLGLLAGLDTQLKLGPLVSPVTFRAPGILAKTVATLDALSNGRAFCGLGAGWWLREHQAYGLDFPPEKARLDDLQVCIETLRALWAPGTKAFRGRYVQLPETTCYPRPVGPVPIIVGGSGERRTLRIVAEQADACNLPSGMKTLTRKIDILHRHCADVGRDPAEVAITVLDLPIVGTDREDVGGGSSGCAGVRRPPPSPPGTTPGWAMIMLAAIAARRSRCAHGLRRASRPGRAEDLPRCAPLLAGAELTRRPEWAELNRDDVLGWVRGYELGWRAGQPSAVESLFTEDARYLRSPYEEPLQGHQAIKDLWVADAGESFTMTSELGAGRRRRRGPGRGALRRAGPTGVSGSVAAQFRRRRPGTGVRGSGRTGRVSRTPSARRDSIPAHRLRVRYPSKNWSMTCPNTG